LKYAAGAEVRNIKDAYFVADLDIYAGNSGSPIFDKNTHEVIGMVVRGYQRDFRWTGKCYISVKHPTPTMNPGQAENHGLSKAVKADYPALPEAMAAECTRVSEFINYCR
jgi:V8-like Glu-specific endopeptidase